MADKRQEILRIIKDTKSLPSLPAIIARLNVLASNPKSSIQEMAHLVSSDPVLSARVLRLVNSPSYGFYRVATISTAMILLGVDIVKSLALSATIFEIMEKSVMGLWEHSLGVGIASNVIAKRLRLPESEAIATAGLLHDIGKVIVKLKFDADYELLITLVNEKDISFREAELELLGVDHAEVGEWLAKAWYMPDKLLEPIAFHHAVSSSEKHLVKTSVVHLANILVKASGFGFSGDEFVPMIQPVAWKQLGMTEQLMEAIIDELDDRLIEAGNFSMDVQDGS